MNHTIGISPKVWVPTALQVVALIVNWIASGAFDRVEVAQVVSLGLTALVGYLASPGDTAGEIGSDELLEASGDPKAAEILSDEDDE